MCLNIVSGVSTVCIVKMRWERAQRAPSYAYGRRRRAARTCVVIVLPVTLYMSSELPANGSRGVDGKFALLHSDLIYLLPVSHAQKNKCRGFYHNVGILLSHKLTHRTMELRIHRVLIGKLALYR